MKMCFLKGIGYGYRVSVVRRGRCQVCAGILIVDTPAYRSQSEPVLLF